MHSRWQRRGAGGVAASVNALPLQQPEEALGRRVVVAAAPSAGPESAGQLCAGPVVRGENLHGSVTFAGSVPTAGEPAGLREEECRPAGPGHSEDRPLFGLYSKRKVIREVEHYNLPTILAVGYCVRSYRGTQFHQWVTARLSEYLERKSMTTRQWIEKLDEQ